jgi:hypothetical protein
MTRKAAKLLEFCIASGKVTPCEACTIAKTKQQNVPKESQHTPAKESNGRVYLDIASLRSTMSPIYQAIPIGESLWMREIN